ncbi:uncharacterized protein LOC119741398 [Patiria miniata]|uniref:Shisa N-terminal domain-containing protein n=1 Tax=Patiria miniata TaxID=46514 RepID=A0A914BA51_PATMI|nr:uncharacterized protein LOC119741398 [Patiria miniata]
MPCAANEGICASRATGPNLADSKRAPDLEQAPTVRQGISMCSSYYDAQGSYVSGFDCPDSEMSDGSDRFCCSNIDYSWKFCCGEARHDENQKYFYQLRPLPMGTAESVLGNLVMIVGVLILCLLVCAALNKAYRERRRRKKTPEVVEYDNDPPPTFKLFYKKKPPPTRTLPPTILSQ